MPTTHHDALIVGAGPNGLAAAITCAQNGLSVLVLEAKDTLGGGARSAPLTLPGFLHDTCSAFHPLGIASPFFQTLPLAEHGLTWIQPPAPLAHPLDDGTAAILERSIQTTAAGLQSDGPQWMRLMTPLAARRDQLLTDLLAPPHLPKHPLTLARFGWRALGSGETLADRYFEHAPARALFAGLAGHAQQPLETATTGAFALLLGLLAHAVGWPIIAGGTQKLADALASILRSLGGQIQTNSPVHHFEDLPPSRLVFLDVTPRQALQIMRNHWPENYRRKLAQWRYGPGAFKVDWALSAPIPWKAPQCARAGSLHLGGTLEEIASTEREVARGQAPMRPFVLFGQQSLFDPTLAPSGKQTAWAYSHVPNGCDIDMTERIEAQVERFAPGFKKLILARKSASPRQLEEHNPNYIGGDIAGGAMDLPQLLARPLFKWRPYVTPAPGVYLCSASTPPGAGVHGMCGYWAAQTALGKA
jgi:phytoene dehydrogenase-like protein